MKLSEFFTFNELIASGTALRLSIKNEPSEIALANLRDTAKRMDEVRRLLNNPVFVTSGYRSPTLNRFIGGSANSSHCFGYAVDFKCPNFGNPIQIVEKIKNSGIKYDQLIEEGGANGWVHISFDPRMRQQTLVATFKNGKAIYREH